MKFALALVAATGASAIVMRKGQLAAKAQAKTWAALESWVEDVVLSITFYRDILKLFQCRFQFLADILGSSCTRPYVLRVKSGPSVSGRWLVVAYILNKIISEMHTLIFRNTALRYRP